MARFQQLYRDKIAPALKAQFGYQSVMEVPRI
ncbi:MAG: 50S ribosomal protein L5, partial [Tepidimonas fonticaldi]|nr:50S ribosomal protein L5 [Tepidimonas fonticaldi]